MSPLGVFENLRSRISSILDASFLNGKGKRGRPPKKALAEILLALICQNVRGSGSREQHFEELTGERFSGSGCSRRLRKVNNEILQQINEVTLRPVADPERNPESFWKGFRLTGVDGTVFNLQNTEAITERLPKAKEGGKAKPSGEEPGQVAFPQINACCIVELGTHAPLAAAIGTNKEGELTLARTLIKYIASKMLLLADQLYGCGSFVLPLYQHCQKVGAAFVVKVLPAQTSRKIRELSDSSSLVEVDVRDRKKRGVLATIILREIAFTITSVNENGVEVTRECRIWTNLLDEVLYPAKELVQMSVVRWEHELYYGEIKDAMPRNYLDSQLVETAAIEIMAMLWASALVAQTRQEVASRLPKDQDAVIRISFSKTYEALDKLLWTLKTGQGVFTYQQEIEIIDRTFNQLKKHVLPPRRKRKCPRKVRQKQKKWPKLRERIPCDPEVTVTITNHTDEGI